MGLPINIEDLINSKTIEHSRIEFKRGWNPFNIIRTVCAFANDIDELGGGYIIIGIEEKDGAIQLPPYGIEQNQLDNIQKEFFKLCQNNLSESFFPLIEPIEFQGKWILVIWIVTGDDRPYKASDSPGKRAKLAHYVRHGSVTKEATKNQLRQLRELSNINYFDSRSNPTATLKDLNLSLILTFLKDSGASLFEDANNMPFNELCAKLNIIKGPPELLRPTNFGLLLFCENPEKFFPGCKTNLVVFADEIGSEISYSKEFSGPIQVQIRDILEYFKSNIIKKQIVKSQEVAESSSFFNYPFQAIEEAVVNSLYHRSFENPEPNQIRVFNVGNQRRIEISSFPGPLAPIDQDVLLQDRVPPKNRNIQLGDALKVLRLTEKYGSGIPTIRKVLANNGSPIPQFITDVDRSHFMVIISAHMDSFEDGSPIENQDVVKILNDKEYKILEACDDHPTLKQLKNKLKSEIESNEIERLVNSLISEELLKDKTISSFLKLIKTRVFYVTSKGMSALGNSF